MPRIIGDLQANFLPRAEQSHEVHTYYAVME